MRRILTLCLTMLSSTISLADDPVSTGYFNSIAIDGHDSVLYHTPAVRVAHTEVKGNRRFTVEWNKAQWFFASQASADKFAASPEKYTPQYNGHCSNALSLDEGLIPTDGMVWEFFDEKLHLFYAERGRQRWLNGDWQTYRETADAAWEELRKQ